MPTQHEILKKHTEKYRTLRVINQAVIEQIEKSVGEAAEEYAKQESQAFAHYINTLFLGVGMEKYWEEYQKSKTK